MLHMKALRYSIYLLLGGVVTVSLLLTSLGYRVWYNLTDSMPRGFYWQFPVEQLQVGDAVSLLVPVGFRARYQGRTWMVPESVALQKIVVALAGDEVCMDQDRLRINGELVGHAYPVDREGLPVGIYPYCAVLTPGMVYLANLNYEKSVDSRYFGPVHEQSLLGKVAPLYLQTGS